MTFTDKELTELSDRVSATMSDKRFRHTKSVEEEITRMGALYLPDQIDLLRASALLHDIAKEMPAKEQEEICRTNRDPDLEHAVKSPAIMHGHTASYLIPKSYPKYALPEIISAVYKHTTGAEEMSVFDKLLFLADFIEPERPWQICQDVRRSFWDGMPDTVPERMRRLDETVLYILEFTVQYLRDKGTVPDPTTEKAAVALRKDYEQRYNLKEKPND